MSILEEEEIELINQFKERVSDVLEHDWQMEDNFLIRWIRAKENDLEAAEELLRKSLEWRKENNVDDVLNVKLEIDYSYKFPWKLEGHAKNGEPVISIPFGKWDVLFTMDDLTDKEKEQFGFTTLKLCEKMVESIRIANKNRSPDSPEITKYILLVDMTGFVYAHLYNPKVVDRGLQMLEYLESNYPGLMSACYIINSAAMITTMMTMLKPGLSPTTFESIRTFSTDPEEWKKIILEIIDEEQLPELYGGTKIVLSENENEDDDEFTDSENEEEKIPTKHTVVTEG